MLIAETLKKSILQAAIQGKLTEPHIARQIMAIKAHVIFIDYITLFVKYIVDELKNVAKSIIPGIERKNLLNAMFPLPPIAEQKRIVEKLEELLPLCEDLAE